MTRIQLNSDIYSHILSFVSSSYDLLALCLSNKELLGLAKPEGVYRTVRCKLDNDMLWNHFISNPAQASRVRTLEVIRHNILVPDSSLITSPSEQSLLPFDPYTPNRPSYESTLRSESLLVEAIKNMVNLESFSWDFWAPAINQGMDVGANDERNSQPDAIDIKRPLYCCPDDIWTVLRDKTRLRNLKVLYQVDDSFPFHMRPILESTMTTLKNLVNLDLTVYHYASDSDNNFNYTGRQNGRGRVNITGLVPILRDSPNLHTLSLAIIDRKHYYELDGNPFTDVTPIMEDNFWPELTILKLHDVTVDNIVMAKFLQKHSSLQTLSAFLSITADDLPNVPFDLQLPEDTLILPNLEYATLPPKLMRKLLQIKKTPSSLKSIDSIEPCDWFEGENDNAYIPELDNAWGTDSAVEKEANESSTTSLNNLPYNFLLGMPNLQILAVKDLTWLEQLQKLVDLTPSLEELRCGGRRVIADYSATPYEKILPIISHWPRLKKFIGPSIWPHYEFQKVCITSTEVLQVANTIKITCPILEEVSWVDGRIVKLLQGKDGNITLQMKDFYT